MKIRDLDIRYWMKNLNAKQINANSVNYWHIDINNEVFIEVEFGRGKKVFSIEFLQQEPGLGVFSYTHGLPTQFLESFIKLAKSFVSENGPDWNSLVKHNEHFRDYITRKTGLNFTFF